MSLQLVLYIIACALIVAAAFGVAVRRVSLLALGLGLWLFANHLLPALT